MHVEAENGHGILLQIVQALSDLDLIISNATISVDSGWFMNVFQVTDHHGHKLRDPNFARYMQRSLDGDQEGNGSYNIAQLKIYRHKNVNIENFTSDCIALEISCVDCPDIFSKVTGMLFVHSFMMDTGEVWTHNGCTAGILYIKDRDTSRTISDRTCLSCLLKNITTVVGAHYLPDKLWGVRLHHAAYRIHMERRLHQLMIEQMDYDQVTPPPLHAQKDLSILAISVVEASKRFGGDYKGKEVMWSFERDYFVGLRLEMNTLDQPNLLLGVSKVFQQNDLSINKAEFTKEKDLALSTFYITDASSSSNADAIDQQKLEALHKEIGDGIFLERRIIISATPYL
ncbi:hypothetical protein KFK09_003835 [Dendrobium nobile]|uniref:ACT domain-containing protein ACR n=1 Tax=Dendrobium nobile TaxID=94219 RepID=A0A8T3C3N7_DENNO|nr:hypothetical protein KFK09_003835 [Dendrobium nobile]